MFRSMLLPTSSSLMFMTFLQLVPGKTSYQPNQLRMVHPQDMDTLPHRQPDEMDTLTQRQTRSMRYKGKTGLADKGEFEAGGCALTFFG